MLQRWSRDPTRFGNPVIGNGISFLSDGIASAGFLALLVMLIKGLSNAGDGLLFNTLNRNSELCKLQLQIFFIALTPMPYF